MPNPQQHYSQTFNSSSGIDMIVTFDGVPIGELEGISYNVTREIAPIYTLGSADVRSFSRGKRGIAGSMVFTVFNRSALISTMRDRGYYVANKYELFNTQNSVDIGGQYEKTFKAGTTAGTFTVGQELLQDTDSLGSNVITNDKVLATPMYHDQIPPFDIVISNGNEHGHIMKMAILGVQIMNTASGLSIDDMKINEACTFVATAIETWSGQGKINTRTGKFHTAPTRESFNPGARPGSLGKL